VYASILPDVIIITDVKVTLVSLLLHGKRRKSLSKLFNFQIS
jgi:hypothetical protein